MRYRLNHLPCNVPRRRVPILSVILVRIGNPWILRSKSSRLVVALLVAATALLNGCGVGSTDDTERNVTKRQQPHPGLPPGKMLNTLSPEPYEIRINKHRLMVPMNHLGDITAKNFVSLYACCPGMQSYRDGRGSAPLGDIEILVDGVFMGRSSGKPANAHAWMQPWNNYLPANMNKKLGQWEYRSRKLPHQPDHYVADVARTRPNGEKFSESYLIGCGGPRPGRQEHQYASMQVMYYVSG